MPRAALQVCIQIACRAQAVPTARQLRRWARAASSDPAELTLRVVGAPEARKLNAAYRRRDYATNVLSFSYGKQKPGAGLPVLGDVVLCHPVIARQAREQGKSLAAHYAHMVVHGVLHLGGLDHRSAGEARLMEARERRILHALGVADPYQPRMRSSIE